VFVDPIADVAVLASPDDQELFDEAEAYAALVGAVTPFTVGEPPSRPIPEEVARLAEYVREEEVMRECSALLFSLAGQWFPCKVRHYPNGPGWLIITDPAEEIAAGMSGSPIISEDGVAIGVVCLGSSDGSLGSPNPRLVGNLPAWFVIELANEDDADEDDEMAWRAA
jgi:hypothetical protein